LGIYKVEVQVYLLPFAIDIAKELCMMTLGFRTPSTCSVLAYMSVPKLIQLSDVPIPIGADLDELVCGIPGMEDFQRQGVLPSSCFLHAETNKVNPLPHILVNYNAHREKARALIFNSPT
jgi:hypothetical protein